MCLNIYGLTFHFLRMQATHLDKFSLAEFHYSRQNFNSITHAQNSNFKCLVTNFSLQFTIYNEISFFPPQIKALSTYTVNNLQLDHRKTKKTYDHIHLFGSIRRRFFICWFLFRCCHINFSSSSNVLLCLLRVKGRKSNVLSSQKKIW